MGVQKNDGYTLNCDRCGKRTPIAGAIVGSRVVACKYCKEQHLATETQPVEQAIKQEVATVHPTRGMISAVQGHWLFQAVAVAGVTGILIVGIIYGTALPFVREIIKQEVETAIKRLEPQKGNVDEQ